MNIEQLKATFERATADRASAVTKFEQSPNDKTATAKLVAEQVARNAERALREAEKRLAEKELAEKKTEYGRFVTLANGFGASIEPEIAEAVELEAKLQELATRINTKAEEQRAACLRATELARELGVSPPNLHEVGLHTASELISKRLVAKYGQSTHGSMRDDITHLLRY